ncbi:unnamed protein product, partial [Ascophyllum nodosum]
ARSASARRALLRRLPERRGRRARKRLRPLRRTPSCIVIPRLERRMPSPRRQRWERSSLRRGRVLRRRGWRGWVGRGASA